jgi:hypothetical protein
MAQVVEETRTLREVVDELLGSLQLNSFAEERVNRTHVYGERAQETFEFLLWNNFSREQMAENAQLFLVNPNTLYRNYFILQDLGMDDQTIAKCVQALSRSTSSLEETIDYFKDIGFSEQKLVKNLSLLWMAKKTATKNYENLIDIGIEAKKIVTNAYLLKNNPETIRSKYERLRSLGLSKEVVLSQPRLFGKSPETIARMYKELKNLGLSDHGISTHHSLLVMNPDALKGRYDGHSRLLIERKGMGEEEAKNFLIEQPQLLTIPNQTIEANLNFLSTHSIASNNRIVQAIMLGTTVRTKLSKIAWLLREVFDYKASSLVTMAEKQRVVQIAYDLVREKPSILVESLNTLNRQKKSLKAYAADYLARQPTA